MAADSETISAAARAALSQRIPLVVVLASSGADVVEGMPSLDGWGRAAKALAECSGVIPVTIVAYGLAVSGPALLLGMADAVVMTSEAVAYVSGPAAVAQLTGLTAGARRAGRPEGARPQLRASPRSWPTTPHRGLEAVAGFLDYLPDHADEEPPVLATGDPPTGPPRSCGTCCRSAPPVPTTSVTPSPPSPTTGSFSSCEPVGPHSSSPRLCRVDGRTVGVLANQPQSMAGTLDIAASQKGARFVGFCDSFNVPLLTLVDTPGFMPGKDLEWRGMIRHGAQLVFAYAEATVPRVCLIMRKAYGGAYIVMDSKGMGNDLCLAWPSAQVAVMGAQGAVQILHRREAAETQARLVDEYEEAYLNPYVAAARGFVDQVIDPADTRKVIACSLRMLATKRERIVARKHGNGPL